MFLVWVSLATVAVLVTWLLGSWLVIGILVQTLLGMSIWHVLLPWLCIRTIVRLAHPLFFLECIDIYAGDMTCDGYEVGFGYVVADRQFWFASFITGHTIYGVLVLGGVGFWYDTPIVFGDRVLYFLYSLVPIGIWCHCDSMRYGTSVSWCFHCPTIRGAISVEILFTIYGHLIHYSLEVSILVYMRNVCNNW